MLEERAERLATFCHGRTGDQLRSVTVYDESGTTPIYMQEAFQDRYTDKQVAALIQSARDLNTTLHQSNIEDAPMGRPIAGIYSFEKAFVIQLPWTETAGVVTTFETAVGSSLSEFIHDCTTIMREKPRADDSSEA